MTSRDRRGLPTHRTAAALAATAFLAACSAPAPEPDAGLPPDFPARIGTVTALFGGDSRNWAVRDFSRGAIDPSASLVTGSEGRRLTILGYPAAASYGAAGFEAETIRIAALLERAAPGPAASAEIAIPDSLDPGAARWTSAGQPASVTIDRAAPPAEGEILGEIAGHFTATLCRAAPGAEAPDPGNCRTIEGLFETQLSVP